MPSITSPIGKLIAMFATREQDDITQLTGACLFQIMYQFNAEPSEEVTIIRIDKDGRLIARFRNKTRYINPSNEGFKYFNKFRKNINE